MNIGKRISTILGGTVLLGVGLAGLAIWSVDAIHQAMKASELESGMTTLAERISSDVGAIAQRVATMTIGGRIDQKAMAELLSIRADYLATFAEFKSKQITAEDQRRLAEAEAAATQWRDADNRLFELLKAGRGREAVVFHGKQVVPKFQQICAAMSAYVSYREHNLSAINQETEALIGRLRVTLIGVGLLFAVVAGVLGTWLTRSIAGPLAESVNYLGEVAKGDLTQDVPQAHREREDEIGTLARAMQTMAVELRRMIAEVSGGVKNLAVSSRELTKNSTGMKSGSRDASDRAHSVSVAAEQMSSNITSVAASMEQTTTNLANVASETARLTSSIDEVAGNSERARQIAVEAKGQAEMITGQIQSLGAAAREIGKVTQTITEISSQTNLLALNATIEAARAGVAGKGFAVVAAEIKALAQQTATATEDIKVRVESVQAATAGGITEIGRISAIIQQVTGIVESMAVSIDEQAAAARSIAQNISEASAGVMDANLRVAETSQVSRDIARDIVTVDQAAGDIARGSDQVGASAGHLSAVADGLTHTIEFFHA